MGKAVTDSASGRYFYYVRPVGEGERWEVMFGLAGERIEAATEQEALDLAHVAAKRHWEERNEPSAVYQVCSDNSRRMVEYFGVRR
jgi:hypothetical protein